MLKYKIPQIVTLTPFRPPRNKAPACESRGFVRKKQKVCILTHLLTLNCFLFE